MKLFSEIPRKHWSALAPLCDGIHIKDEDVLRDKVFARLLKATGIPKIVSMRSSDVLSVWMSIEPDYVLVDTNKNAPQYNIPNIVQIRENITTHNLPCKIIGVLYGGWIELETLRGICDEVALHWDTFREKVLQRYKAEEFVFLGFKNADELYRHRPKMLISSMGIIAARNGIDLETRKRRPKNPSKFRLEMVMSEDQIALAAHNLQVIKEAGNG